MWIYIVCGLVALGSLATITLSVKSHLSDVEQAGYDKCRAEWEKEKQLRLEEERKRVAAAESGLTADRATRKAKSKANSKPVEIIIEKPIYRNICIDPAGVSCINAAIKGNKCDANGTVP